MKKFYLNRAASLQIATPNGESYIEFTTLIVGTSTWGVFATDDAAIQLALSKVNHVKEISQADYDQYLKKKPRQNATSNWPKSIKTIAPDLPKQIVVPPVRDAAPPPIVSIAPDRSKVHTSSDFESASTALSTPAEVLAEQGDNAFASSKEELADALGMKVWHARFKFYWAHKDKPAKVAGKGHSVSAWKAFIEKVQYDTGSGLADDGEGEGPDKE